MRALARWGVTPLLAAPLGAWALGLGDIELQSALNQPFRAQIVLVSATAEELQGLRVTLAGPDTFSRYGLDRPDFLSALEFRVAADRTGRGVIQVTSRESIAEPFVTLLVEATWPRGRLLREYTVLLDPPVLLAAPAAPPAVQPAQTRPAEPNAPGGAINRPAPPPAAPAPRPQVAPGPSSSAVPPAPRVPAAAPGGSYGPVQRAETLWAIAERHRPNGVSMNQMMVAVFEANPQAFGGNMNVLRAGATLRLPEAASFDALSTTVANAEVRRQTDEWRNRSQPGSGQLRLLPPAESGVARTPAPAPGQTPAQANAVAAANAAASAAAASAAASAAAEESRRLLQLRDEQLRNLQQQAAAEPIPSPAGAQPGGQPGVDLETPFADEAPAPVVAAPVAPAPVTAPAQPAGPSFVSRLLGWITSPVLLIGLGVAGLLLGALLFVRRRRQEPEDITGSWEELESEVDDTEAREATERMRRQARDERVTVEEPRAASAPRRSQQAEPRPEPEVEESRPERVERSPAPRPTDETLSSHTIMNLDAADPVAEADFHMAYGLYDQAAELVQKALDAAPNRRDLKLKLLEVFFVWGNKDAFLKEAQNLREELGERPGPDWDKVAIMGSQICPDESLFGENTSATGLIEVDLADGADVDLGDEGTSLDFILEASDIRAPAGTPGSRSALESDLREDSLNLGERTAADLETAMFEGADAEDAATQATPNLAADNLDDTQESPTIERPRGGRDWSRAQADSPTSQYTAVDEPTVETPAAKAPPTDAPTVEMPFRGGAGARNVNQPARGSDDRASEFTAEIDLDDLGLDVEDLEGQDLETLQTDLSDLPMAEGGYGDTREQPALRVDDAATREQPALRVDDAATREQPALRVDDAATREQPALRVDDAATREQPALKVDDDEVLSATGLTNILRVSKDEDEDGAVDSRKKVASGDEDEGSLTGTAVFDFQQSGDTSLVESLQTDEDLDLGDLSAALHGGDTVEQPLASMFRGGEMSEDFSDSDFLSSDDPTGEEMSPLDPQTMTEVGTKLDLARAYIDMGDPEGARSILEEVLGEGDPNQRREAQSLIDGLRD